MMAQAPYDLLEVSDLKVHFPAGQKVFGRARSMVHAVDGEAEVLGLAHLVERIPPALVEARAVAAALGVG